MNFGIRHDNPLPKATLVLLAFVFAVSLTSWHTNVSRHGNLSQITLISQFSCCLRYGRLSTRPPRSWISLTSLDSKIAERLSPGMRWSLVASNDPIPRSPSHEGDYEQLIRDCKFLAHGWLTHQWWMYVVCGLICSRVTFGHSWHAVTELG